VIARSESSSPPAEAGRTAQAVGIGLVLLTISWALLHVGFWDRNQIIDTPVYKGYGTKILDGEVPYRDFPVEYPPAALPVFVLPALAEDKHYATAFELLMWTCAVAALVLVATTLTRVGASALRLYAVVCFIGLAPLALGSVVLSRFDLWPAALAAGALAALAADRDRLGFGLLGLATAAKLYPAVMLPIAFVWVGKRRGWREAVIALAVFVGVGLAVALPFAIVSPGGLWDSLTAQLGRPLQIEALGAGFLLAAHQLGLYEPTVVSTHGSQNLDGTLPDALAAVQTALQVIALVAVWMVFSRSRPDRERLLVGCATAVVAFVAFGKVLSPQFLIWLLPLVPLVAGAAGLTASAVLAAAFVVTQVWFPYRYWDVVALRPAGWLVLVRDLLLFGLLAGLLLAMRRESAEPRSA
jgi:Glycosyltransferase family 87